MTTGTSVFRGKYDTPWRWDAAQSNFSITTAPIVDREVPLIVEYERVRPHPEQQEQDIVNLVGGPIMVWGSSADSTMNIQFTPLSSGEYGAAHTLIIDATLGKEVASLTGGYINMVIGLGIGWGETVSKPDPTAISFTVDVADVMSRAIVLASGFSYVDGVYNAVYRVCGIATGRRVFKASAFWRAVWVHGEAQDLDGVITLTSSATIVRSYLKQDVLPLEPSAASSQTDGSEWEIV